MNGLVALAGALPALALMAYVDKVDAKRPEPRRQLRRVAVAGALATPLALLLGGYLARFSMRRHWAERWDWPSWPAP